MYVNVYVYVHMYMYMCVCIYIYIYITLIYYIHHAYHTCPRSQTICINLSFIVSCFLSSYLPTYLSFHLCSYVAIPTIIFLPPRVSRPRYDIFSGAVQTNRPYGALNIFHTGCSEWGWG